MLLSELHWNAYLAIAVTGRFSIVSGISTDAAPEAHPNISIWSEYFA